MCNVQYCSPCLQCMDSTTCVMYNTVALISSVWIMGRRLSKNKVKSFSLRRFRDYINAKVAFIKADNALINVGWLYKREGGIYKRGVVI